MLLLGEPVCGAYFSHLNCLSAKTDIKKVNGFQHIWRESKILLVVSREFVIRNILFNDLSPQVSAEHKPKHYVNWLWSRLPHSYLSSLSVETYTVTSHSSPSALIRACKSFTFSCSLCFLSLRVRLTPRGPRGNHSTSQPWAVSYNCKRKLFQMITRARQKNSLSKIWYYWYFHTPV